MNKNSIKIGLLFGVGFLFLSVENVSAGWVRPTSHNDVSNAYYYEYRAYDGNTSSYAYTSSTYRNSWTPYLEFRKTNPIFSDKIRFYQGLGSPYFTQIDIDAYYDGYWHDIYQGSFSTGTWIEKNIPDGKKIIEYARIRLYVGSTSYRAPIYEFQFWDVPWAGNWVNPDGHVEGDWSDEIKAYDDNTGTETIYWIPPGEVYSPWLELTLSSPITSDRIQFYTLMLAPNQQVYAPMEFEVYKNGSWEFHYVNNWGGWKQFVFYEGTVSRLRVRVKTQESYRPYEWGAFFSEFDFGEYTCDDSAPDPPNLVSPSNGATGVFTSPTVFWGEIANWGVNCAGNDNTYTVYLDTSANPSTDRGSVSSSGATSLDISGLSEGILYYWKVRASNGALYTDSSVWSFTTEITNNNPNTPTSGSPHNIWINYNPTYQVTVSDPDGGNVRAYFSPGGWGGWVSSGEISSWGPVTTSDTSGSSWRAYAQDPEGATSSWSGYRILKKDTVDPLVVTFDQENGISTDTSIWVNISVSDERSGIAYGDLDVRVNGGAWQNVSNVTSNTTYTGNYGSTYVFRYRVRDPANNWSNDGAYLFDGSVRINGVPSSPTSLLTNGQTNPSGIVGSPYFSAIYNDPDPSDTANGYQIQVDDNSNFSSIFWDSGVQGMSNCSKGARCQNITYTGSSLTPGVRYYWRIRYRDDDGYTGSWSTESAYFDVEKYGSIRGTVWLDFDGDCVRDAGEGNYTGGTTLYLKQSGVTKYTFNSNSNPTGYNFAQSGVLGGVYDLVIDVPPGYRVTTSSAVPNVTINPGATTDVGDVCL